MGIKNFGTGTPKFNEGIIVSGSLPQLYVSGNININANVEPGIQFQIGNEDRAKLSINTSNNLVIHNQFINKHIVFKVNDQGSTREGIRIDGAVPEVVVNEGSESLVDFRVESNNNTHMLFVDGGNEKVGIGTSTPSTTLHAYADVSNAYVATVENDQGSAGHGLKVTSDGTGAGTYIFDIESDSTTLMRVRGDGRVGIGKVTSLPAAVLTVSSSNTDSDIAIANKIHHIGSSGNYLQFISNGILVSGQLHISGTEQEGLRIAKGDSDYRQIVFENDGVDAANIHLSNAENLVIMNETAGKDIQFWVDPSSGNDIQAMTIKEDGKVGIGVSDPESIFHVHSDTINSLIGRYSQNDNSSDGPQLELVKGRGTLASPATINGNDFLGQIKFMGRDGDSYDAFADMYVQASGSVSNSSHPGKIVFRTAAESSTSLTERFTILPNGNIGIGDGFPQTKLGIAGSLGVKFTVIDATNDPGTAYTVQTDDHVILINTRPTAQGGIDSAITVTLPLAASGPGRLIVIKDAAGYSDTNSITIQRAGSDSLDGDPSRTSISIPNVAGWKRMISDGVSGWYEIG